MSTSNADLPLFWSFVFLLPNTREMHFLAKKIENVLSKKMCKLQFLVLGSLSPFHRNRRFRRVQLNS